MKPLKGKKGVCGKGKRAYKRRSVQKEKKKEKSRSTAKNPRPARTVRGGGRFFNRSKADPSERFESVAFDKASY